MKVKLPQSVIRGLKIGLKLERQGLGGRGLVDETIKMARTGVRTGKWDEWKIVKASNWFARHVADRSRMKNPSRWDKAPKYSPAYVAWALWGDDGKGAGRRWIDKKARELKAQGVKASPRKNPPATRHMRPEAIRSKQGVLLGRKGFEYGGHGIKIGDRFDTEKLSAEDAFGLYRPRENPPPGWAFLYGGEGENYVLRSPIATAIVEQTSRGWDWFIYSQYDAVDQVSVEGSTNRRGDAFRQALAAFKDFDPLLVSRIEEEESRAARIGGRQRVSRDFVDFFRRYSLTPPAARVNPPRTQPYEYGVPAKYLEGLSDKVARQRAAEIIRRREAGVKTSKPLPGDKTAQRKGMKGSKWTRMYKDKYGPYSGKSRAAIARETGIKRSIINEVYKRGVGASRTQGRRPGATDSSWALARTHAFVMKVLHGKGTINQDPDLARQVKAARRNPSKGRNSMSVQFYDIKNRRKVNIPDDDIVKKTVRTKSGTRYQLVGITRDNRKVYRFISKADYQVADYPVRR